MRLLAATLFSFCLIVGGAAAGQQATAEGANPMSKSEDLRTVAPALDKYGRDVVLAISGSGPVFRLETAAS
jgi:4-carboxymuconolactone decarboxylase